MTENEKLHEIIRQQSEALVSLRLLLTGAALIHGKDKTLHLQKHAFERVNQYVLNIADNPEKDRWEISATPRPPIT